MEIKKHEFYYFVLEKMLMSRACDLRNGIATRQGDAWFSLSASGHEILACLPYFFDPNDIIVPHYRDMPLMIARGMSIESIARNVMSKSTDNCLGRNMSSHFCDANLNIFSIASPVASQCLPATGMAWGIKLKKQNNIVYCGIGDASIRQGEFYEAVCFAIEKKLPILFVVSDNGYGISTNTENQNPFNLSVFSKELYYTLHSSDVPNVFKQFEYIVNRVRSLCQPMIIVLKCDRLESHASSDDHRKYRTSDEINKLVDPIEIFKQYLFNAGILNQEEFNLVKEDCFNYVESVYNQVRSEPEYSDNSITDHLYSHETYNQSPKTTDNISGNIVHMTNQAFFEILTHNPNTLFFGEDIEDPKGGVFGLTKNLSSTFPDRVINSPLAEATILGVGVGLAAVGIRPFLELQFIDFIGPALNQLMSQIATLRWRSAGTWSCPLTIYAPYGAYNPGGGIWHSQSNEALLSHIPGILVKVVADPKTAYHIFQEAAVSEDPTLVLIPKHLMRKPDYLMPKAYGQLSNIRLFGNDITIVCWGNSVDLALEAKQHFSASIEIIELVSLVPCDWHAISNSIKKTGILLIIQEDNVTSSFGTTIVSHITTQPDMFYYLKASPRLIARRDVHIPFNKVLESKLLPDVDLVVENIKNLLAEASTYENY